MSLDRSSYAEKKIDFRVFQHYVEILRLYSAMSDFTQKIILHKFGEPALVVGKSDYVQRRRKLFCMLYNKKISNRVIQMIIKYGDKK